MSLLGKSPVTIARETWQTGRLIMDRIDKTSGEEGDRRVGATALAGTGIVCVAIGGAVGISKIDFTVPERQETAVASVEVCEAYDHQASDILGRLAMDGRLTVAATPTVGGGTELSATVGEWGTHSTLTFLNPDAVTDPALMSPDLTVRGSAVHTFLQSPDSRFVNVRFDGNKALSGTTTVAGEAVLGEYYSDNAPVSVEIRGVVHPDGSASSECQISSVSGGVRQAGRAEAVPVDEAAKVELAVFHELAASPRRYM